MAKVAKSETVPKPMQKIFDKIVWLTDEVCKSHLNDEYAQLARYVTAALCRKRPSPLVRGRADAWACGIINALGTVNFLFDKSEEPYLSTGELSELFGISKSTSAAKSKIIRDLLGMEMFSPNWCLPSRLEKNPLVWLVKINGFPMDARSLPREVQEVLFRKGIIPYIPADKAPHEK
uniref:DUF6398 domain-containing protein n=1 Tax=Candidatus Kentrum sp. FM TaxID=2126340 RepID=A0A450WL79_9GAMM|nr:MAG: hypothetical protein BECKFM1743A_GA0114220_105182 [Candidatus Kentron sp. FM]VFJ74785.1 MAG: hypothetical protein BECKFM1743C_GA0114222_108112 [Candidatus Kentron sp. FM]VFK17803.1 MAG: hypothetical protein BECKFM1743B_GA0114221_105032 [Candidatus Kentron sp. FM]